MIFPAQRMESLGPSNSVYMPKGLSSLILSASDINSFLPYIYPFYECSMGLLGEMEKNKDQYRSCPRELSLWKNRETYKWSWHYSEEIAVKNHTGS